MSEAVVITSSLYHGWQDRREKCFKCSRPVNPDDLLWEDAQKQVKENDNIKDIFFVCEQCLPGLVASTPIIKAIVPESIREELKAQYPEATDEWFDEFTAKVEKGEMPWM